MNNIRQQAMDLSSRNWAVIVFRDSTTEDEPIYVALNPELEGCLAQGDTPQEAIENLAAFRADYIEHSLKHGLEIPTPREWVPRAFVQVDLAGALLESNEDEEAPQPSSRLQHFATV